MCKWKREANFVVLDFAVESPLALKPKLFNFSQLLFILFFVTLSEFFDYFKTCLLNSVIGIIQTRNHVREQTTLMINFVR